MIFCFASASGQMKIGTSTGDIRVEGASVGALSVSVSTGRVELTSVACEGDLAVTVSTGKAKLTDVSCEDLASSGSTGSITMKCNSVTDLDIINKLSEASCAGVQVELIIRGICCILPGVEGETDNVSVTSIVGRLLEHSRIYCFGEGDDTKVYLSSADLMTRNTERRVEIAFPVENPAIKERIGTMMQVLLSDNERAERLCNDGSYARVVASEEDEPLNAQSYFMQEAIQKAVWVQPETAEVEAEVADAVPEEADPTRAPEPEDIAQDAPKKKGFFGRIGDAFRRLFGRSEDEKSAPEPAALLDEPKDE